MPDFDISTPQSARIWNYWLGGADNYAVDREAGDAAAAQIPDIPEGARAERAFLVRAVRHLVDRGVRQFLDVGTGLPTANNTHEVAQRLAPESRVVYVDNDPIVLAHARALLTSTPEGRTDYLDADLRRPDEILPEAERTLDFDQPVGLMLLGVVNHVVDDAEAHAAVADLLAGLAPGSYLVLTHSTAEIHGEPMREAMREITERGGTPIRPRTAAEIEEFFKGTTLLEPGVVTCSLWRPDDGIRTPRPVHLFGGVGRLD
ncbi:SAM-dependent methyltransferase [Saccharopolyspora griseoalba]|uniref:SAM-dependent methyltransferase n=1 Tax=Saccharopolyspora griseoalba TaxID=1431848 RepID=A0ABW2LH61_9PSEU